MGCLNGLPTKREPLAQNLPALLKSDALEVLLLPHSFQSILLCLQGTTSPFQKETVSGLTHPLKKKKKKNTNISIDKIMQMGTHLLVI